jgi:hypothetical protein
MVQKQTEWPIGRRTGNIHSVDDANFTLRRNLQRALVDSYSLRWSLVSQKLQFLQEPHGVTSL